MTDIADLLRSDIATIIGMVLIITLLVLLIVNFVKTSKIKKKYEETLDKLGNGDSLDEMLKDYISKVSQVEGREEEILNKFKYLDNEVSQCIKKVGLVRYNAFEDTGSDLSFALALLDRQNNGVVLNGIYSKDSSNIYSKSIKRGESNYRLSKEEIQAIEEAKDIE